MGSLCLITGGILRVVVQQPPRTVRGGIMIRKKAKKSNIEEENK
jgi:hypothetical protein